MSGRILRRGAAALMLLLATSMAPEPASATSFANLTLEQFTDASTLIVEGDVARVWTEMDPESGLIWTRAEVKVSTLHKGTVSTDTLVIDSLGGEHDGIVLTVPGQAVFSKGENVFLFLDKLAERYVPVSKFQGKFTVRRAPGDKQSHAMRWHASSTEDFDHRFLPHPAADQRIYLDDLRETVQRRLDAGWDGKPIPGITGERLELINTLDRRLPR